LVPQNVFAALGTQVPVPQFALQTPVHADAQHTLPTQNPVEHSPALEHVAPCRLLKLAVTEAADVTVRLHGELLVGVQPDHDTKVPVPEAVAASVTTVPWLTSAEQEVPQLIPRPIGLVDTTLPVPVGPPSATWSRYWFSVNVAVTVVPPAATVTVHGLVLHPAPESVAVDPVCAVAETVTCVPRGIDAEHVGPQFRLPPPAQVAVTVPAPLPPLLMLKLAFLSPKVAVTVAAAMIEDTVHVAPFVVVHPIQDLKSESAPAVAVKVTVLP
jgi:hypothetical protein